MQNTIITLSNLIDSSCFILGRVKMSEERKNYNSTEKINMVDRLNANHDTLERAKKEP